jgi:ribonucleoside-diphosphate reductase alpha chain
MPDRPAPQPFDLARLFTKEGTPPDECIGGWTRRDVEITDRGGKVVFAAEGIEAPASWSQFAVDILASKYLRKGGVPVPEGRETSLRQLVHRVTLPIAQQVEQQGLLDASRAAILADEIAWLMVNQ